MEENDNTQNSERLLTRRNAMRAGGATAFGGMYGLFAKGITDPKEPNNGRTRRGTVNDLNNYLDEGQEVAVEDGTATLYTPIDDLDVTPDDGFAALVKEALDSEYGWVNNREIWNANYVDKQLFNMYSLHLGKFNSAHDHANDINEYGIRFTEDDYVTERKEDPSEVRDTYAEWFVDGETLRDWENNPDPWNYRLPAGAANDHFEENLDLIE